MILGLEPLRLLKLYSKHCVYRIGIWFFDYPLSRIMMRAVTVGDAAMQKCYFCSNPELSQYCLYKR